MHQSKYTPEQKIEAVKAFRSGRVPFSRLREAFGINPYAIYGWLYKYEEKGSEAFQPAIVNPQYSSEYKTKCVQAYLRGEGSLNAIAAKYHLSSQKVLKQWIKRYNANQELEDYNIKPEGFMANRIVTQEERKEIAEYCLAHNKDYRGTATLYDVSYDRVYRWVQKYLKYGEAGLSDKRGHHKPDSEVSELERLRRENHRLKQQLKEREMSVQLLKKVKEFERK